VAQGYVVRAAGAAEELAAWLPSWSRGPS
jgi:hypothetical protein